MKQFKKCVASLLLAGIFGAAMTGCTIELEDPNKTTEEAETTEEVDFTSIRPQDDFYGYINGEDLSNVDVLYYNGDAGAFGSVSANLQEVLRNAVEEIVTSNEEYEYGSKEQRIRDYYNQYVEYYTNEALRNSSKEEIRAAIDSIMASEDIDTLVRVMFDLQREYNACSDIIYLTVGNNDLDPTNYCVTVSFVMNIAGVSVEDIDYWQNNVSEIEDPVSDFLTVAGLDADTADEYARDLAGVALDITWNSNIDFYSASSYYEFEEVVTYEELDAIFTNIDYRTIEELSGITENPYGGWLTYDKGQLTAINNLFVEDNLNALKAWLVYSIVNDYGDLFLEDYPVLAGYFYDDPRDINEIAVDAIMNATNLSDEISDLYVEVAYTDEMEFKLRTMCEDIREGYRSVISSADWLTEETRDGLLTKLDNIVFLTGGDIVTDEINTDRSDAMGDNYWETMKGFIAYDKAEFIGNIGQPFNRLVIGMPMNTVNACYQPNNTVTITVAIMGSPFFDVDADYYTNLGGLGAVIAHEIGHAFDSNCIVFDSNGRYDPEWICESDRNALEERNQAAIHYFETTIAVFDVYYVDGAQTLGENYADLGGMEVITSLCHNRDELEALLTNYAQIWSTLMSTTSLVDQLGSDEHSPAYIRVNSILATLDVFYEMYDVQEGDGLYVAPENRIGRWY